MDYVEESGTLLIGTNTEAILTHNIADLLLWNSHVDEEENYDDITIGEREGEEYKEQYDDGYDVMEG